MTQTTPESVKSSVNGHILRRVAILMTLGPLIEPHDTSDSARAPRCSQRGTARLEEVYPGWWSHGPVYQGGYGPVYQGGYGPVYQGSGMT